MGEEEGFSQQPPPPPPHPRSRGVRERRPSNCCLVPPGGPGRCPLRGPGIGTGEKGAKNLGQKNREGPSDWPAAPPPSRPSRCAGAGLGSSEQPGRELRRCGTPWGFMRLVAGQHGPTPTPEDVLLPFPLPPHTATPKLVPSHCCPALSPTGIPPLWLSVDGGGRKGTGRALDSPPSPHPSPNPGACTESLSRRVDECVGSQSFGLWRDTDPRGDPTVWAGPEDCSPSSSARPFPTGPGPWTHTGVCTASYP